MLLKYTAARSIQTGHVATSEYCLPVDVSQLDRSVKKIGSKNVSLAGSQVSVIHRVQNMHNITTEILASTGIVNKTDMREFLDSVVGGETFTIDIEGSDNLIAKDDFEDGTTGNWDTSGGQDIVTITGQDFATKVFDVNGQTTTYHTDYIPVTAAETLYGQCWIDPGSATDSVYFGVSQYNGSYTDLSADLDFGTLAAAGSAEEISGDVTIGGSTVYVRPYIRFSGTPSHGTALMTHPFIYRTVNPLSVVLDGETFKETRQAAVEKFRYSFKVREL